ncbi:hypothetical protein BH24ACT1_BH24ACT1_10490 [soil metagenome]
MATSHYEVLGVAVTASGEDIRTAFRRRAREVHPDRYAGSQALPSDRAEGSRQSEQAMREINEAWRVLGDPGRRRAYDVSLLAGSQVSPMPRQPVEDLDDRPYFHAPAEPGDIGVALVRGLPWVAALVVLVGIFVFTAFAGGDDDGEVTASDLVGACVRLERGGVVTKVPCDEPNSGRVDLVAVRSSLCPEGSSSARLPGQGSWLCLRDP